MKFEILENEYWWGGTVVVSEQMPVDRNTVYTLDLFHDRYTQSAPLFLSSKGRYIWSEEPFVISFDKGHVEVTSEHPIIFESAGETLRDAYIAAMKRHFPFEKDIRTPREFYQHPQFNTWMELIKNQNEKDIIKYAQEIIDNGYKPGILMIDGGWQKCQGNWEFNKELISDPKGMVDKLHEMGFIVMIWVSPFICPEGDMFLEMSKNYAAEGDAEKNKMYHLLRTADGEVSIQRWWSGYGAIYNFMLPADREHMNKQLRHLMDDYGFDGFKFDGGTYLPKTYINGTDFYGGYTVEQLNIAWVDFGAKYKFHEYKDTWKQGGKPVIQRLFDKKHSWDTNGLNCLVPHMCFSGLIGCPFICPDMVGGGSWTAFVYGEHDEELFARMAECSALFPMMQFSSLPWRHLSEKVQKICLDMAQLHEKMYPEIEKILSDTEKTGEPIIRHMAYEFPDESYETTNDMFMLGSKYLVAPVLKKGEVTKKMRLPKGSWKYFDGTIYDGGIEIELPAEIDVLPYFERI